MLRKKRCAILIFRLLSSSERRYWMKKWLRGRESRSHMTLVRELRQSHQEDLFNYLRMSSETFNMLLTMVKPYISKMNTKMRQSISAEERLIATLRYLATGQSFEDLKFPTRISPQSLGVIIPETSKYICLVLKDLYMKLPSSIEEWQEIARGYESRWQIPNCGGAIDGKHIRIRKRANSGSYYYNYKHYFSIVLMAVVNANYEFIYVDMISELHGLIKEDIKKNNTNMRKSISSEERLAVCLRYLSTGDSFRTIAFSYRIGESTVANIIEEVCDALWKYLQPKVLPEPTQETWKDIAADFKETCQFDHCCGAIDGKHVTVKASPNSGSDYFNYKKTFSIVLLAVADARRKFTIIDVGSKGRFSDGGIFSNSEFGKRIHNGQLQLPEDEPLTPGGLNMPFVFIGDEAFPLLPNLMRVYPKDMLSKSRRIFNYRLCRARRVKENAFGVLSSRWRVYKIPLECRIDMVDKIIKATCVLHNYFIQKPIDMYFNVTRDRNLRQVGNNQLTPLEPTETTYNENVFIREEFCRYFNTVGAVSWQDTRIRNRLNVYN